MAKDLPTAGRSREFPSIVKKRCLLARQSRHVRGSTPIFAIFALLLLMASPGLGEAPGITVSSGNLPLLIVAGHGGKLALSGAEIRQQDKVDDPDFLLLGDTKTVELATDLAGAVEQEAGEGRRPSLIINQIHRRYADVNRKPQQSSHDPVGIAHHAAFHDAVHEELSRLVRLHGWALLLDIHGQSRYPTTLLLGTGRNTLIGPWSRAALWGRDGLVPSLQQAGFSVEPTTAAGKQVYGGGYTIRHHGADGKVEAWQMEHSRAIRDQLDRRSRYLEVVAGVLVQVIESPPQP